MEKGKVKQILFIAVVSLATTLVYNWSIKEYYKSKTATPKTTA